MSKHIYLALDSDVLRNLSNLYALVEDNPEMNERQISEHIKRINPHSPIIFNIKTYLNLLDIAKDPESDIRLLVTATPFHETKSIPNVTKFIKKFCYVPNINILTADESKENIRKLAKEYCSSIKTEDKVYPAPMQAKYDAHVGSVVPSNDAYVMAEATYFGAFLLTENVKDLIDKKNNYRDLSETSLKSHAESVRVKGIVTINIKNGYCEPAPNTRYGEENVNVPKPVALKDLFKLFLVRKRWLKKENVDVFTSTEDKRVVKFDELEK